MNQFTPRTVPVKATRVSDRQPGRFGVGLTNWTGEYDRRSHTAEDESWAAAAFNGSEGWDDSREMEERAMQAAWEATWDGTIDDDTSGFCGHCGLADDFIDPITHLCPPCDLAFSDQCSTGNHGR